MRQAAAANREARVLADLAGHRDPDFEDHAVAQHPLEHPEFDREGPVFARCRNARRRSEWAMTALAAHRDARPRGQLLHLEQPELDSRGGLRARDADNRIWLHQGRPGADDVDRFRGDGGEAVGVGH